MVQERTILRCRSSDWVIGGPVKSSQALVQKAMLFNGERTGYLPVETDLLASWSDSCWSS